MKHEAQAQFDLITTVIHESRKSIVDHGKYWLTWGLASLFAAFGQSIMLYTFPTRYHWITWPIFLTLAGIVSFIIGIRDDEKSRVKTYYLRFITYLWSSFGFVFLLLLTLTFTQKLAFNQTYPLFILFYGLATYISGGMLRFRPLIIGGVITWFIAIAAFYTDFKVQVLLLGLSLIISYIIPGYLLYKKYNREV